jgi:hypothetical protein
VERRNGRRRSDAAAGSHQQGEDLHDAAAGRSGHREGRRSNEVVGNGDGSHHGEDCSHHEEGRGDRSSRPQEDHRDRRGHHSHDHGSRENESGNGAHEDAGSRIAAVLC